MKQLALDIAPPAEPGFDNFIVGRNGELLQTLRLFAAGESSERMIYVWGAADSGRTHLLQASVAALDGARYLQSAPQISWRVGAAPLIALDDVGRLDEAGQIELFNLYNTGPRPLLLVAGNSPPARLALRKDLTTRLGAGLIYQVHALSDEEKITALARCANERGLRLNHEVGIYLLRHTRRDMRSLLALFNAADVMALAEKRDITVPLIKTLLHSTLPLGMRD